MLLNWEQALRFSFYNPLITDKDIEPAMQKHIGCSVQIADVTYDMTLMNWDNLGCFLQAKEEVVITKSSCKVTLSLNDRIFESEGKIVASYGTNRIGVIFEYNKDIFNWNEFYNVLDQKGFTPQYLAN